MGYTHQCHYWLLHFLWRSISIHLRGNLPERWQNTKCKITMWFKYTSRWNVLSLHRLENKLVNTRSSKQSLTFMGRSDYISFFFRWVSGISGRLCHQLDCAKYLQNKFLINKKQKLGQKTYGCQTDPTEKSVVTAVSQCCSTQTRLWHQISKHP